MSELPSPGVTLMPSDIPETSLNSEKSTNSDSGASERLKRIEWKVNAAVAGESLPDVMIAVANVLAKEYGKTHFGLISHTLASMAAVVRFHNEVRDAAKKPRRKIQVHGL